MKDIHQENKELKQHLWRMVFAAGHLLDDKYSEGDASVKKGIWARLHRIVDEAREYLLSLDEPNHIV